MQNTPIALWITQNEYSNIWKNLSNLSYYANSGITYVILVVKYLQSWTNYFF